MNLQFLPILVGSDPLTSERPLHVDYCVKFKKANHSTWEGKAVSEFEDSLVFRRCSRIAKTA